MSRVWLLLGSGGSDGQIVGGNIPLKWISMSLPQTGEARPDAPGDVPSQRLPE